jgi:hypothetical protein
VREKGKKMRRRREGKEIEVTTRVNFQEVTKSKIVETKIMAALRNPIDTLTLKQLCMTVVSAESRFMSSPVLLISKKEMSCRMMHSKRFFRITRTRRSPTNEYKYPRIKVKIPPTTKMIDNVKITRFNFSES